MKKYKLNITVLSDEELSPDDVTRALDALNANFTNIDKMTVKPATKGECKDFGRNASNCNIQKLLGHSSSKTTEIYTHISTQLLNKLPLAI